MQKEWFENKQHHGENKPNRHHGRKPPIRWLQEPVPTVGRINNIEPREASQKRGKFCLQGKRPLQALKQLWSFEFVLPLSNRRQQNGSHKRHAANPENDGENMQRTSEGEVIHQTRPIYVST